MLRNQMGIYYHPPSEHLSGSMPEMRSRYEESNIESGIDIEQNRTSISTRVNKDV
jgi:hypothetical protein